MDFKMYLTTIFCLLVLVSCKNSDSENENSAEINNENQFSASDTSESPRDDAQKQIDSENNMTGDTGSSTNKRNPTHGQTSETTQSTPSTGNYIKVGQENDNNCRCYCLELNFSTNTELCLVADQMYINTRMQRNKDNSISVFLVEPSSRNVQGKDIPWQDFDKNVPIATISPHSGGELEFDWLGFTINGDLAMDYAIFGKKTLEGSYKKK